eukprot:5682509-Alexandrium_andersonii.AAC.1
MPSPVRVSGMTSEVGIFKIRFGQQSAESIRLGGFVNSFRSVLECGKSWEDTGSRGKRRGAIGERRQSAADWIHREVV